MSLASHIKKLNAEWRKSLNPAVDEDSAVTIIKQILLALQHCHECGVAHRNLQPENIIYDNSTWKLSGFHQAAPINSDSEQADLKSVGVLLTRLLTDERKMPETLDITAVNYISEGAKTFVKKLMKKTFDKKGV